MEAIRLALRHKADLARIVAAADRGGLGLVQEGASVAAVWLTSTYLEGEQNTFAAFG